MQERQAEAWWSIDDVIWLFFCDMCRYASSYEMNYEKGRLL